MATCARCDMEVPGSSKVCRSCGAVVGGAAGPSSAEMDTDRTVDRSVVRDLAARLSDDALTPVAAAAASAAPDIAAHAAAADPTPARWCERCGTPTLRPSSAFCSACGHALQGGSPSRPVEVAGPGEDRSVPSMDRPLLTAAPQPVAAGDVQRLIGAVERSWSARWRRGIQLVELSLRLIRQQPGLLWVPVAASAGVGVLWVVAALLSVALPGAAALIVWIAALAAMATVAMTGQAVIIHRVAAMADGGTETTAEALRAVRPRLVTLAAWGAISLTVGLVLRGLERQRGIAGLVLRIAAALVGAAWSALTFFVIPVVIFEGLGVRDAMRRSRQLLRNSWGEGVIGVGVLTLLFNVAGLAAFVLAVFFAAVHAVVLSVLVLLAAVLGINLLSAVASPVFTLVLYRFATQGETVFGFQPADLAATFRRPRRTLAGTGVAR